MLLTIQNLTKSYGAHTVLNSASFVINAHEHIGIVGPNGVGKTTLLRLLTILLALLPSLNYCQLQLKKQLLFIGHDVEITRVVGRSMRDPDEILVWSNDS